MTSYVSAVCAVASATVVAVLLFLSASGVIFPRRATITLHTETVSKVYDAEPITGGEITVTFGELRPGHELVTLSVPSYTEVGEYDNAPKYIIVDSSGDDVTGMYDVTTDFGKITVRGIPLSVHSQTKSKRYDGTALISDEIQILTGNLAEGHIFIGGAVTRLTLPGEQDILPTYSIIDENGVDVTGIYEISEYLGTLTVIPIYITVSSGSAEKSYDGTPLSANEWEHVSGELLEGHSISAKCITKVTEVGEYENEIEACILDKSGKDVSELYKIVKVCGNISILPLTLHIETEGITKEYDGIPISCDKWSIVAGSLAEGESITVTHIPTLNYVGSAVNKMVFVITDKNGVNVTHRYQIIQQTGQLVLTPRTITIRTGSATKVYDGTALVCEEYEITNGSLCEGDTLNLAFTSIVNVGYTQNYIIDYYIQSTQDGDKVNVTSNYRVSYDYGTLTVTAQ